MGLACRGAGGAQVDGLGADPEAALGPGPRSPLLASENEKRQMLRTSVSLNY